MKSYLEMTKTETKAYRITSLGQSAGFLYTAEVRVDEYFKRKTGQLKTERDIARLFGMTYNRYQRVKFEDDDEIIREFLEDIYGRLQDDLLELMATGAISNGPSIYNKLYPDTSIAKTEFEEQDIKVEF